MGDSDRYTPAGSILQQCQILSKNYGLEKFLKYAGNKNTGRPECSQKQDDPASTVEAGSSVASEPWTKEGSWPLSCTIRSVGGMSSGEVGPADGSAVQLGGLGKRGQCLVSLDLIEPRGDGLEKVICRFIASQGHGHGSLMGEHTQLLTLWGRRQERTVAHAPPSTRTSRVRRLPPTAASEEASAGLAARRIQDAGRHSDSWQRFTE
ncbi:hypothetical protein CDD82_7313 [Ophiocordyceps australis]|uniref:Uncharacterized protein n=1 Tax=Ophiocordyceps australis TaxID=1399860 RepID=A0A2C5ZPR7_9HYPO|nr:hypothetical protein CDD82_7313 [Ophiocordyceps australis]